MENCKPIKVIELKLKGELEFTPFCGMASGCYFLSKLSPSEKQCPLLPVDKNKSESTIQRAVKKACPFINIKWLMFIN